MQFLTRQDIEDRRTQGCKESELYAEPSSSRLARANEIIREITGVFKGVRLGDGIGLFEGDAIDDYEPAEERSRQRAKDEKDDWRKISATDLNRNYCSLCFFDPAGMRFHLPAFMCCDLRGEFGMNLEFRLTDVNEPGAQQFSLFKPSEKSAVAAYLEFLAEDVDGKSSREEIAMALNNFWKADA